MDMPLIQAPFDRPLKLAAISDPELESLLSRLGLFQGQTFVRQDEEALSHPVRVRSSKGDIVLGGGMATRTIVHLEDGRKMPLTDMKAGQTGHIEGTTCSNSLLNALATLDLNIDEPITFLRKLPHMEYTVLVEKNRREKLTEGLAAKIWGCIDDRQMQFVSADKDQLFVVEKVLGGDRALNALQEKGIVTGKTIVLEAVALSQTLSMATLEPVVITTDDGLHLHLRQGQAEQIRVELIY